MGVDTPRRLRSLKSWKPVRAQGPALLGAISPTQPSTQWGKRGALSSEVVPCVCAADQGVPTPPHPQPGGHLPSEERAWRGGDKPRPQPSSPRGVSAITNCQHEMTGNARPASRFGAWSLWGAWLELSGTFGCSRLESRLYVVTWNKSWQWDSGWKSKLQWHLHHFKITDIWKVSLPLGASIHLWHGENDGPV